MANVLAPVGLPGTPPSGAGSAMPGQFPGDGAGVPMTPFRKGRAARNSHNRKAKVTRRGVKKPRRR